MNIKGFKISKKAIVLIIMACILIPVVAYSSRLVYILYFSKTPTFVPVSKEDPDDTYTKPIDIPTPEQSGIDNIVLFGVDSRTENDYGRTDSIIIATVDKNSKTLKLTSIMRDLYVKIGSTPTMDRVNAAYTYGGPEMALETLNRNFGLDLKYYAIIDFKAFQELVDKLDGIEVNVKESEVAEINKYIAEVNGNKSTYLKGAGFQHLNGQQALSFARIRKVGNGDWERTERQRIVLKSLAEKAKKVNLIKIPDLLTTMASYAQTNLPLSKIVSLGITAYGFGGGVQQMRIPVDGYYQDQRVNQNSVLVPDIKANAQFLKEFIYNIKAIGNMDVPAYMQNNFHMDDSVTTSRPRANIPDYSTPDPTPEPGEEGVTPTPSPGEGEVTPTPSPGEGEVTPTPSPGEGEVTPTPSPGEGEITPTPSPGEGEVIPTPKPATS